MIAAPIFLESGLDLVVEAAKAGINGAFPTPNARSPQILDAWLADITQRCQGAPGGYAANLILHASNARREDDLARLVNHRVPWAITPVGSPVTVIERVRTYGGRVLADVATIRHARKAIDAGVDLLVLLTADAGGTTTGRQVRAVQMAGALLPLDAGDLASWKTAWSAGHGVASIRDMRHVDERVHTLRQEWLAVR